MRLRTDKERACGIRNTVSVCTKRERDKRVCVSEAERKERKEIETVEPEAESSSWSAARPAMHALFSFSLSPSPFLFFSQCVSYRLAIGTLR